MPYSGDNMMDVKRVNRSVVIRILHENGAMSRKRLAEMMKLTPAAITKIIGEMLNEGLLAEGNSISSGNAGRREILIDIDYRSFCTLGVLVNLRRASVSAVWPDGTVIFFEEIKRPTHASADETVALLSKLLLDLVKKHDIPQEKIIGLGIAVRGITSADGRYIENSYGALAEHNYPLADRFEEATGFRTVMHNNVRALFSAQMYLSKEDDAASQFFLRCEYGIGASLSINGRIWHGVTEQCSEIGHIPVIRRGGKLCACGKCGCLETISSPTAIREDALSILSEENTPVLWSMAQHKDAEELGIDDILNAALCGDAGVAEIVDRAIIELANALKSVIYIIDPGKIVLYGRMFENHYFLSRLLGEMQEGVDTRHNVQIEKSCFNHQLEDKAAALLAVQYFFDNGGIL